MILEVYKKLLIIAEQEFNGIIADHEIIFSYAGRARKLRLHVIDTTFIDIWYSSDGDYSFHWEQKSLRNKIYRHDNAPHGKWAHILTFPKHCHDGLQDHVVESRLSDKPEEALREFLSLVRDNLIGKSH